MSYTYATKELKASARAVLLNQKVSTKQACEVASFIRGKTVEKAMRKLESVIAQEQPVPYKRFLHGVGHKPGMVAGRYPIKTAQVMLKLLKLAKANAEDLSLNTEKLKVVAVVPNRSAKTARYGRIRGQTAKGTHIEMVVQE